MLANRLVRWGITAIIGLIALQLALGILTALIPDLWWFLLLVDAGFIVWRIVEVWPHVNTTTQGIAPGQAAPQPPSPSPLPRINVPQAAPRQTGRQAIAELESMTGLHSGKKEINTLMAPGVTHERSR